MTARQGLAAAFVLAALGALPSARAAPADGAGLPPPPRVVRRELDHAQAQLGSLVAKLPNAADLDIAREPLRVILRIPAWLLFDPDSATLRTAPEARSTVEAARTLLARRRHLTAAIEVHTDGIGGTESNLHFSQERADALLALLQAEGIAAARLRATGLGPAAPLASDMSPAGRVQNRRVEVVFERAASSPPPPVAPAS